MTGEHFQTTQWSLVMAAGQGTTEPSRQALADLCARYWLPLYTFARRRGAGVHDAQDLTQAFFTRLLEKNILAAARPERGRFRSFLLTAFQNFMVNEWKKQTAQKRGGSQAPLPMDFVAAESRYQLDPVDHLTPEKMFDRTWTLTVLEQVLLRLRGEQAALGNERQFELLKPFLTASADEDRYDSIAMQLQMSPGAARGRASAAKALPGATASRNLANRAQ